MRLTKYSSNLNRWDTQKSISALWEYKHLRSQVSKLIITINTKEDSTEETKMEDETSQEKIELLGLHAKAGESLDLDFDGKIIRRDNAKATKESPAPAPQPKEVGRTPITKKSLEEWRRTFDKAPAPTPTAAAAAAGKSKWDSFLRRLQRIKECEEALSH